MCVGNEYSVTDVNNPMLDPISISLSPNYLSLQHSVTSVAMKTHFFSPWDSFGSESTTCGPGTLSVLQTSERATGWTTSSSSTVPASSPLPRTSTLSMTSGCLCMCSQSYCVLVAQPFFRTRKLPTTVHRMEGVATTLPLTLRFPTSSSLLQ